MIRNFFLVGLVAILVAALVAGTAWGLGGVGTSARTSPDEAEVPRTAHTVAEASEEPAKADETFYVVAYDWSWAVFTEDGAELDRIQVKEGTTVEIYAVNVHAQDAIDGLPPAVAAAIRAIDWKGRTVKAIEEGRIPLPEGVTPEEALEMGHDNESEGDAHDEGPENDDAHNGDTENGNESSKPEPLWPYMDDHGFLIPWYGVAEYLDANAQAPTRVVFKADRLGEFEFVCTNYCGLGHKYMPRTMLVVG